MSGTYRTRPKVGDLIALQLRDYLQETAFPEDSVVEAARRLGLSEHTYAEPWWQDITSICEAAGLDLGIVVKDRAGSEVTIWPEKNFSETSRPQLVAGKRYDAAPGVRGRNLPIGPRANKPPAGSRR